MSSKQNSTTARRIVWMALLGLAMVVGLGSAWWFSNASAPEASLAPAVEEAATTSSPPDSVEVPAGMVYVPGGVTKIGNDTPGTRGTRRHNSSARPTFEAKVGPFLMNVHPVTVAQFRAFVDSTGYETQAERFGDAGVLDPTRRQWQLVKGATWRQPLGPEGPAAQDNHPVTQVSWNDATAYCKAVGKRLPTEVEWEHAARGAHNARRPYAWGNERVVDGQHQANTWQGRFPTRNTVADGYRYTSPVGAFGKTELGLTDMGGNVWEWTRSWYRPYDKRDAPFTPTKTSERVQRGGSFQCNECQGFRVYRRSHSTPETSLFHVGFRCVKDVPSG